MGYTPQSAINTSLFEFNLLEGGGKQAKLKKLGEHESSNKKYNDDTGEEPQHEFPMLGGKELRVSLTERELPQQIEEFWNAHLAERNGGNVMKSG